LPPGVVVTEIDLDLVLAVDKKTPTFVPLPRFPSVERDLALVIRKDIPAREVMALIRKAGGELLRELRLFDVYEGRQIREGYRNLGFSLVFRAEDRTLTDEEVGRYLEAIIRTLEDTYGAQLRA